MHRQMKKFISKLEKWKIDKVKLKDNVTKILQFKKVKENYWLKE